MYKDKIMQFTNLKRRNNKMKLGLAEWGFNKIAFNDHFKATNELGVKFLEIGAGSAEPYHMPMELNTKELAEIKELITKYNVDTSFGAIGGGYDIEDEKELNKLVETQKKALDVLALVDTKIVRIFAGWAPADTLNEKKLKNMIYGINELDKHAASKGMKLAIETHGSIRPYGDGVMHLHNVTTRWDLLENLINNLPANTGILFDPGNMRAVIDRPLSDYVKLLNDSIIACHIKDWRQNADGSWNCVAIGETDFNWLPIFEAIKYDGIGLIEYENTADVMSGTSRSIKYLKSIGFTI